MRFVRDEVPVAYSMVSFVEASGFAQQTSALISYQCLWSAFNNIYIAIAKRNGLEPTYRSNPDGSIKTIRRGDVEIPLMNFHKESKLIYLAFEHFPDTLKRDLILHESTNFFVYRKPKWRGIEIPYDASKQRINGVINIGFTVNGDSPVWSPISHSKYGKYISGEEKPEIRDELSYQILYVLYTVRNNLVHAGKQIDDSNDLEVLKMAARLLQIIVKSFVH